MLGVKMKENINVCIVMLPRAPKVPYKFLTDLLKIFRLISQKIFVITGNTERINKMSKEKISIIDIGFSMPPQNKNIFLTFFMVILFQIKTCIEIFKARKEIDVIIFYVTWPFYLLPLVVSKLLRKKTVDIITRSKPSVFSLWYKIYEIQDKILLTLLDYISPESPSLISNLHLEKYSHKILPSGARFIDTDFFNIKKPFSQRKNVVGYVGRLVEEKGVKKLLQAIELMNKYGKITFLLGGEGPLFEEIKKFRPSNQCEIVKTGWIPEKNLPNILNELKLLVLPTQHAEGLPTIILEAMACGTPVLATPVGGIPDVIKDEETGFIMENNSPECIAKNIIRALNHPNLEKIARNARKLVEKEFNYEQAVKRWRKILEIVSGG